jgi:type II secretory pathway pseudopilin PulG
VTLTVADAILIQIWLVVATIVATILLFAWLDERRRRQDAEEAVQSYRDEESRSDARRRQAVGAPSSDQPCPICGTPMDFAVDLAVRRRRTLVAIVMTPPRDATESSKK